MFLPSLRKVACTKWQLKADKKLHHISCLMENPTSFFTYTTEIFIKFTYLVFLQKNPMSMLEGGTELQEIYL